MRPDLPARLPRLLCTLWIGVMAGFFWSFSTVVMPGLALADPPAALEAMQAINRAVRNPLFGLGFFGAAGLCLVAGGQALLGRGTPHAWLALAGALIYLVGVFGVTVGAIVPLNRALAAVDPVLPQSAEVMAAYIRDWGFWNHVRTLAALAALVLFALADRTDELPLGGRQIRHGSSAQG